MRPIILIATLSDFVSEAPPPALVRLSLQVGRLDLQTQTRHGLIWLSDQYPATAPAAVHAQLPAARAAIAAWLQQAGYHVRPGRWATPRSVTPPPGRFECIRWELRDREWVLV